MDLPIPDYVIPAGSDLHRISEPGNYGFEPGEHQALTVKNVGGVNLYGLGDTPGEVVFVGTKLRVQNSSHVQLFNLTVRDGIRFFDETLDEQSGDVGAHHILFDMLESRYIGFQVSPTNGGHIYGVWLADCTFRCAGKAAYIGLLARQVGAVAGVAVYHNVIETASEGFNLKNVIATDEYPQSFVRNNTIFHTVNLHEDDQAAIYIHGAPDGCALQITHNMIGAHWLSDGVLEYGRVNGAGIHITHQAGNAFIAGNLVLNTGGEHYQDGIHVRRPGCLLQHNTVDRTAQGVGLFVNRRAGGDFRAQNNAFDSVELRGGAELNESNLVGSGDYWQPGGYYPVQGGPAWRAGVPTEFDYALDSQPFADTPSIGCLEDWPSEPEPPAMQPGVEYVQRVMGQKDGLPIIMFEAVE